MNYLKLGKLPIDFINFFYNELLKRKDPLREYQLIHLDLFLFDKFQEFFINKELTIPWLQADNNLPSRPVQKGFYSPVGSGWTIHKDGIDCKSALNVALSSNDGDWVRWYNEDVVNSISSPGLKKFTTGLYSRDTDIENYEDVPFVDELRVETGDVYALDTDKFHSFKCIGPNPRLILQTKFFRNPSFEIIVESLSKESFSNIIKNDE